MGTITDNTGNVIGTFEDTLEDWRQAAQVEAKLRRELQAENKRLRAALEKVAARDWKWLRPEGHVDSVKWYGECSQIARAALEGKE